MSSRAPDDQEFEIQIEGRVHLGELLRLKELEPAEDEPGYEIDYVEDSTLPPHKRAPVRLPSPTRSTRADFCYEFERSGEQLYLEDDAMALQYGILGSPGSGKTNLLIYLLRQIISHCGDKRETRRFRPARKFGGIILDPKAALIKDVRRVFSEADREEDLVVINSRELKQRGGINLIDCMLAPKDLAKALVLAAQSAGAGAHDPFWFQQMSNAFGAILALLEFTNPGKKPTVSDLITAAVGSKKIEGRGNSRTEPALNALIREAGKQLGNPAAAAAIAELNDARIRLETLSRHAAADQKNRLSVEQFMEQAFALFRDSAYQCYSAEGPAGETNIYDQIVDDGKVLLVSPGSQELELSSILPSLVKLVFQRTVLSRFDRFANWQLHNCERPLLFLADEYHTVATQIPGERVGDSEYFSMARQFGGLCLVATQTVKQLETSGLKETWQAVFGTLAAVIGMKGDDPATIKYLQERAGKKEVLQTTQGFSSAKGEVTITENAQRVEAEKIPAEALKIFRRGDAVVIGTITGHGTPSSIRYVKVPWAWSDLSNRAGS